MPVWSVNALREGWYGTPCASVALSMYRGQFAKFTIPAGSALKPVPLADFEQAARIGPRASAPAPAPAARRRLRRLTRRESACRIGSRACVMRFPGVQPPGLDDVSAL